MKAALVSYQIDATSKVQYLAARVPLASGSAEVWRPAIAGTRLPLRATKTRDLRRLWHRVKSKRQCGADHLTSFTGGNDGANPQAALVQGSVGSFYGTTSQGDTNGLGPVFRMTIVPEFQAVTLKATG
jgi:hypothetical protein